MTLHPHVHPGHLLVAVTGCDQAVHLHVDVIVSSSLVPADDLLHHRVDLPDKFAVAGTLLVGVDRQDEQQRRVRRVVPGLLRPLGEEVGHQAPAAVGREGLQDGPGRLVLAGGQAAARQGQHGVPPPVLKEGEARQDGLLAGGGPVGNELHGRQGEVGRQRLLKPGSGPDLRPEGLRLAADLRRRGEVRLQAHHQLQGALAAGLHRKRHRVVGGGTAQGHFPVLHVLSIIEGVAVGGLVAAAPAVGLEVERQAVGLHRRAAGHFPEGKLLPRRDALSLGDKLQLRLHRQGDGRAAAVGEAVGNGNGVAPLLQHQSLLHRHPRQAVAPLGIVHEGKGRQGLVSPLRQAVALEVLAGERVCPRPHRHRLPEPVDHVIAAVGGMGAGHQHRLVVAAAGADDGLGGKAAQAVGHQIAVRLAPGQGGPVIFSKHILHRASSRSPRIMPVMGGTEMAPSASGIQGLASPTWTPSAKTLQFPVGTGTEAVCWEAL